jgi:hypothetical protein
MFGPIEIIILLGLVFWMSKWTSRWMVSIPPEPAPRPRIGAVALQRLTILLVLVGAGLFTTILFFSRTQLPPASVRITSPPSADAFQQISYSEAHFEQTRQLEYYPFWGFLFLGLTLAGIAIAAVKIRHRSHSNASAAETFTEQKVSHGLGWGWLVIPGLCFAGLITEATFLLNTPAPADLSSHPTEFPQRHERMLKLLKSYAETLANQPGGISSDNQWLVDATSNSTDSQHIILVSGAFSTAQEAEAELLPLVAEMVQQEFHKRHPWQGHWTVPMNLVRERAIEKQSIERVPKVIGNFTGDLFRQYWLVNLSPVVLDSFEPSWKAMMIERRLVGIGLFLGWIFSQLLIGLAYFQTQGANHQPDRWRWKLAGTFCSIAITAATAYGLEWISAIR